MAKEKRMKMRLKISNITSAIYTLYEAINNYFGFCKRFTSCYSKVNMHNIVIIESHLNNQSHHRIVLSCVDSQRRFVCKLQLFHTYIVMTYNNFFFWVDIKGKFNG